MLKEAIRIVLIVEKDSEQRPIYYTSKALHGREVRYQKMENLAYAIVLVSRRLKTLLLHSSNCNLH